MRNVRTRLDQLAAKLGRETAKEVEGVVIMDFQTGEIISGRPNPRGVTIYLPRKVDINELTERGRADAIARDRPNLSETDSGIAGSKAAAAP